jgi:hypothetical protein
MKIPMDLFLYLIKDLLDGQEIEHDIPSHYGMDVKEIVMYNFKNRKKI